MSADETDTESLQAFAASHRTVVALTGEIDQVADPARIVGVANGHVLMSRVTAMGCAGTALIARGEFSIVIAGLAAAAGSDEIKPIATAYVLVLAIGGPLVAKYSDSIAERLRPSTPAIPPRRR